MTDECIHGLDLDRCDVCSPKPAPTPAASASVPRARSPRPLAGRTARDGGTSSGAPRRSAAAQPAKKPIAIGEQRIHHLTHIGNLAAILANGGLRADAGGAWETGPEVDISSPGNREARRTTAISGTASGTTGASAMVADYVPFFLSPNANLWEGIRAGVPDRRLSPSIRALPAAEFVMLVSTVRQVTGTRATEAEDADAQNDSRIVVTDDDAADALARFATTGETTERMLRRILGDSEHETLLRSEFLVKDTVPFESIALVGVANDKARDAVRAILAGSGYQPRVAVHPPWFALPAATPSVLT